MGTAVSQLGEKLSGRRQVKILLLGLSFAGKTTILYKLKLGQVITTAPSIEITWEKLQYKDVNFTVLDVCYYFHRFEDVWKHFFHDTQGIIFVVDSSDKDRITEARNELHKMLGQEVVNGVPLLVYANKQDLPNAMSASEIAHELHLHSLSQRFWHIQNSCGISGEGLTEGLAWLHCKINSKSEPPSTS